jgi:hypothetical protein
MRVRVSVENIQKKGVKRWATCKLTLTQSGESSAASGKSSVKLAKNGGGRMNFANMRRWTMPKKHLRKTKEYQILASYRRRKMNEMGQGYITKHDVAQAYGRIVGLYVRAI